MEEYAIYLRKSRADVELEKKGEMETLATHLKILTKLANERNFKIVKIYKEIVSGESIAERPEMIKLLNDVNARKYKGVLVFEVERLARGDTKDQGTVAESFKYSDTLIITPSRTYNPNNEDDEEYFEFGLFMSRREYKTIRRRITAGKYEAVREGNYIVSSRPYGYDILRRGKKNRTLIPNDESQYVVMIFEWFVNEGIGADKIAKRLTTMGVPTLTRKSEWNRGTISDILKNPLYIGKIVWGRRKIQKSIEDGVIVKKRPVAEDYEIFEGKHDGLIPEELFNRAQEIFKIRRNPPVKSNVETKNPFAGLLRCRHCGRALVYVPEKGGRRARIIHPNLMKCKVKSSPFDEFMDAFIFAMKEHVKDFEMKMNNDDEKEEAKRQTAFVKTLEKEFELLEEQRKNLFDYFERKIYTEQEFIERKQILTEKINTLQETIKEEKAKEIVEIDYREKIVTFQNVIDSFKDNDVSIKHKNELVKNIISRIEYDCIDLGRNKGGQIILDIFLR